MFFPKHQIGKGNYFIWQNIRFCALLLLYQFLPYNFCVLISVSNFNA